MDADRDSVDPSRHTPADGSDSATERPNHPVVRFCRSRRDGRRCTRPLDHPGLHRSRAIMWADAAADAPRCEGSGRPAEPAAPLPDGYPHGRALCPVCGRFVALAAGALVAHDASDAEEPDAEVLRRREWLNTHGW